MVKLIVDYKKTTQKSPCKICQKLILKGDCRIRIEGANNQYMRDYIYCHSRCVMNFLEEFNKEIPTNNKQI